MTSPSDGDEWYDGTNMKFRIGVTTDTFLISGAPAAASVAVSFTATTRIPVNIGGTIYYIAADTSTW